VPAYHLADADVQLATICLQSTQLGRRPTIVFCGNVSSIWQQSIRGMPLKKKILVVVAYAFKSHNWPAKQRHHRLQSAVWTSHRVVLSVGRI